MASHVGNVRRLEAWAQKEEEMKKSCAAHIFWEGEPPPRDITRRKLFIFFSSVCVRRRNTLPQSRLWYCHKKVRRALTSFALSLPERRERKGGKRVAAFLAFSHKGRDWRWHVCKSMISNASLPSPRPPCCPHSPFPPPFFPEREKREGRGKRRERREKKKWKKKTRMIIANKHFYWRNVTPSSLPPQQLQVLLNSIFKVLLQLSLAVLVCYRSFAWVFSLGWNLPPLLRLHLQATRLLEKVKCNTVRPKTSTESRKTGF